MGNKRNIKLIALIILFLCVCMGVYGRDEPAPTGNKPPLRDVFAHIEGYQLLQYLQLSQSAEAMLDLDDYLYADFAGDSGRVNLYIGYYYSSEKASAAHSPTICYPSQGWKVEEGTEDGTLKVGPYTMNYEIITTSFGMQKELVFYWYQARLETNTKSYFNKIDIALNQLLHNYSQHGFVRVSVPITNTRHQEARKIAKAFIAKFYPLFQNYMMRS